MDVHIYYKYMFEMNDKVQGFNVSYDPNVNKFNSLIDFIQKYPDKEINIFFKNGVDVKSASTLCKTGSNVRICLDGQDIRKVSQLKGRGCKFYFKPNCSASSYWELKYLVENLGVDSLYIFDDLCYNLEEVSEYCHSHGVRLRVILNRCPSRIIHDDKRLMFYRPQDMGYLERYYDIAEFECGTGLAGFNAELCEMLYRRFFTKRDWYGNIQDINPTLPFEAYNRQLPLPYIKKRSTCKLRCLQEGSSCTHCESFYKLMGSMVTHDLQFDIRPKAKTQEEKSNDD